MANQVSAVLLAPHIFRGQEFEAVARLPDFSKPSYEKQKAVKTGTDLEIVTTTDLTNTCQICAQQRISANSD